MPAKISLIGKTFGKLKVIADAPPHRTSGGHPFICYRCLCECGNETIAKAMSLRNGDKKSCGCAWNAPKNITHGHASDRGRSKAYIAWDHMIQRCTNPNCKAWEWYGARGITVTERWKSFANFIADMGPRPDGMTLERKNSNGNYEPSNCCWDSNAAQARSKRTNRNFTINGITGCMTDLAKHFGLEFNTVRARIDDYGWDHIKAFTTPAAKRMRKDKPSAPSNFD